ncbi:hypothetical protein LP419_27700 [Massilia sp. H-1]|nr:hypothetical protein LP419_27700 [Massilia sp. H-1]
MSQFDQSIPVLTEVFSDQAEAPAASAPVQANPERDAVNAHLEERAVATWSEPEWALLEARLTERILHQLQGRVDFVLEQRLRDSMEDVLKHAIVGLTSEIRTGLQDTIERIVVRAVAQELTHLQALKK